MIEHQLIDYHSLGPDFRIEGTLKIKGETNLFGSHQGDIFIEDQSPFTIEDTGKVVGNIEGSDIIIRGFFKGVIRSRGKVTLKSSAHVIGEIHSQELEVFPGAELEMKVTQSEPTN